MRATIAIVGVGLLLGGCALSPPVHSNGLPRVPRYTNAIQLDFILSSTRAVAEKAAAQPDGAQLVDEACLGWERTVFDLHSARLYPSILRQAPETLMLEQVWQDLPTAVQRSPRPTVCESLKVPVSTTGMPSEVALGSPVPVATPAPTAMPTPVPSAPPELANASPPPATSIMPGPSALPVTGLPQQPSSEPTTAVGRERVALQRLRMALSQPVNPPANPPSAQIDPTLPLAPPTKVDLPVLLELADSDLPMVRLRARFHLLGLCTLAVEAADRLRTTPGGVGVGIVQPIDPVICAPSSPTEPLRMAQRRRMRSLLSAWRTRGSEPMADLVANLANFVSRDNPVLDGPRTSR
jgi:hypothetical protein